MQAGITQIGRRRIFILFLRLSLSFFKSYNTGAGFRHSVLEFHIIKCDVLRKLNMLPVEATFMIAPALPYILTSCRTPVIGLRQHVVVEAVEAEKVGCRAWRAHVTCTKPRFRCSQIKAQGVTAI